MLNFIPLLVFFLLSPAALACGCSKPAKPSDVRHYTHMFNGQVIAIAESRDEGVLVQSVTFKINKRLAGPAQKTLAVSFGGPTSCDLEKPDFVIGQSWLISDYDIYLEKDNAGISDTAKLIPSGLYHSNFCSLRERLDAKVTGDGI